MSSLQRVFSPDFYLSAYPDVELSGFDPWVHFSKFGLREGRSPNPYVDPEYIANVLGLTVSDVLIEIFSRKELWTQNTSRYVDIQNFVISGPWDGTTHPLEQMIEGEYIREPWVRFAPFFSDLSTIAQKNCRLTAVSILDHITGQKFRLSRPKGHILSDAPLQNLVFDKEESVLCIPGFALVVQNIAYSLSNGHDVISPDRSAIRTGGHLTLYEYGETLDFKRMIVAPSNLGFKEAVHWIKSLEPGCAVVPTNADQEFLLRHCIGETNRQELYVLPYGVQSLVTTKQVSTSPQVAHMPRKALRSTEKLPRSSVLILAESSAEILKQASKVLALTERGGEICISNNQTVPFWLNLMSRKRVVVLCGNISWADMWIKKGVPIISIDELI